MTTNYNLHEVTCSKAVQGAAFAQGSQDYIFTIGAPNCINMSRSYFKIDMSLEGTAGVQPSESDLVAFADNAPGNLFTNAYFRMGGQDCSTITSFLPQASMLKKRMGKSQGWLSTVGKSAYMDNANFASRCAQVSSRTLLVNEPMDNKQFYKGATDYAATVAIADTGVVTGVNTLFVTAGDTKVSVGDILVCPGIDAGVASAPYTVIAVGSNTDLTVSPSPAVAIAATTNFHFIRKNIANSDVGKNVVTVLWQPPLGIFDHTGWLGAGDYRLSLTPSADYAIAGLESIRPLASLGAFRVVVQDIRFYVYQGKQTIPSGMNELGLIECALASKALGNGASTNNLQFSVPPSTMFLTVFVQTNSVGNNPPYPPSKFKCASSASGVSGDTTLTSIQLTYASISKPSTRWTSEFKSAGNDTSSVAANTNIQKMTQRYNDSYLENNNRVDGMGGIETFGEWIQRGPFYHFIFARDLTDRATEVQLNLTFSDVLDAQAFLCSWYHNTVAYNTSEGMITQLVSRQV